MRLARRVTRLGVGALFGIIASPAAHHAPVSASAQVGAATFGVALNKALDKVSDLIRQAQNSGQMLEVAAGGQIATAIANAKLAYETELDKTATAYSTQMTQTLISINSAVSDLSNHAFTSLDQATKKTQVIVNTLPFSRTTPQVASYGPDMIIPSSAQPSLFHLDGNFVSLVERNADATLRIGSRTVTNLVKTTTQLAFAVPGGAVQPASGRVSYTPARLSVPYQVRCYVVAHCDRTATFDFLLIGLPPTPGKLTFTLTTDVPTVASQTVTSSGEIIQDSDRDDLKDIQHCVPADHGWRVVPSSVERIVVWSQGREGNDRDWWWNNNTSNETAACWNLTTIVHHVGTSGKVHFKLRYLEQRDTTTTRRDPTTMDLEWSSIRSFHVPAQARWESLYERFDGRKTTIVDNQLKDPYLHVSVLGSAISFLTPP